MKNLLIIFFIVLMIGCNQKAANLIHVDFSKDKLLLEHNKFRKTPLVQNQDLENFAQKHAEWMASRNRLRHSRLNISDWNRLGENIAWGQSNETEVTKSWMNSSGHRANIKNEKFTHVGFGFAKSSNGRIYWCANFGG